MKVLLCALLLSLLPGCNAKKPAALSTSEGATSDVTPPILDGSGQVGRFVMTTGTYVGSAGEKINTVVRLDTMTGRAWMLENRPMMHGRDDKGRIPVVVIDGQIARSPAWSSVMEPRELFTTEN
jgi:hypothetical protein